LCDGGIHLRRLDSSNIEDSDRVEVLAVLAERRSDTNRQALATTDPGHLQFKRCGDYLLPPVSVLVKFLLREVVG
jgi:hypothetical protein